MWTLTPKPATEEDDTMKQTISVLVENQAGVLNKITGLFSRRAFNIESLAVGVTDDPTISRITIIVDSGNSVVEQVEKQLNKLVDVIKVRTLDENKMIGRELMIIKVSCTTKTRVDIMNVCQIMGAKIADVSPTTMTLELSDTGDRLELFQSLLRPFSILEVARTGLIAVQKGSGKM
jgi:acetolactate synthase-1/3 small subunit